MTCSASIRPSVVSRTERSRTHALAVLVGKSFRQQLVQIQHLHTPLAQRVGEGVVLIAGLLDP